MVIARGVISRPRELRRIASRNDNRVNAMCLDIFNSIIFITPIFTRILYFNRHSKIGNLQSVVAIKSY